MVDVGKWVRRWLIGLLKKVLLWWEVVLLSVKHIWLRLGRCVEKVRLRLLYKSRMGLARISIIRGLSKHIRRSKRIRFLERVSFVVCLERVGICERIRVARGVKWILRFERIGSGEGVTRFGGVERIWICGEGGRVCRGERGLRCGERRLRALDWRGTCERIARGERIARRGRERVHGRRRGKRIR